MPDDDDIASLFSSATLVFVGTAIGMGSKFVERIIIANFLSPELYGEVAVGIAIMTIGSVIGMAGFQQGIPRYMAQFEEKQDLRGIWLFGTLISGFVSLIIGATVFLFAGWLATSLFHREVSPAIIKIFGLVIPLLTSLRIAVSTIQGFENTIYRSISFDLMYPISRTGILVALLWTGVKILSVGLAYLAATSIALLTAYIFVGKLLNFRGAIKNHSRKLATFSAPLALATMSGLLLTRMDTVMVGAFRGSAEVGLYEAAFPLANALTIILGSFGFFYYPLASRLDSEEKHREVKDVYQVSAKWIFILTFPLFATLIVFPEDILALFFPDEYQAAATALIVLSFSFFVNATFGRNRETLSALGHSKLTMHINVATLLLNVALNLALIPQFGYNGAAFASLTSFIFFNVASIGFLYRQYEITPFSRHTVRTFVVVPTVFLPILYLVSQHIDPVVTHFVIIELLLYVNVVAIVWLTGCFQKEDKVFFDQVRYKISLKTR